jgi:hypothetical protein
MTVDLGQTRAHDAEKQTEVNTALMLGDPLPSRGKYDTHLQTLVNTVRQENPIPVFDFLGLRQNVLDQQEEPPQQQIQEPANIAPNVVAASHEENGWPEVLPAAQLRQTAMEINLNAPPPVILQDLNDLPMEEDPQEVMIHLGIKANNEQNNWELGQSSEQQMIQEILLPQPAQQEPQEEVAENVVNGVEVPLIHLLNEENQFLHLEIPENAIMNDNEIQEIENEHCMDWQQDQPAQVNNIELGMVRIIDRFYPTPSTNEFSNLGFQKIQPYLQQIPASNKAVFNYNSTQAGKGNETSMIEIPKKWAEFFKVFLNSADRYSWARDLLNTQFPSLIFQPWDAVTLSLSAVQNDQPSEQCGKLSSLNSSLISDEALIMEDEALIIEEDQIKSPQGKKRARKGKVQTPVVDSEVRRSSRVKGRTNGFKPSGCKITNCLGCKLDPPTIPIETLQAIGTQMCQMNSEEVEQATLIKKKKPKPIAKKKEKTKISDEDAEAEEGASKEKKND